jgi:heptosyltransferase-2
MPILTPTEELRRILVCRTDGLGDLVVTLPMAVAIRQRLPEVEVSFLVSPYTAPIAERIGEIDRVLPLPTTGKVLHLLREYRPDAILFARPTFQLALDALLARIDVRIGTGYRLYSGLFTRWVYEHRRKGAKHEAEYSVNLLSPLFEGELPVMMPKLQRSARGADEVAERLRELGVEGEYMVLHPGSRGSASNFTPEGYGAVLQGLLEEHRDMTVLVTAGPGEERLARRVVELAGGQRPVHLMGGISLEGLSELLRRSRGFLGSSSGPAHLAALVGTPVVGLYPGLPPMWPARWRPLGRDVTTLVPLPDEPLCPRCEREHEPENCVKRIRVERIIEACHTMLVGAGAGTEDRIIR